MHSIIARRTAHGSSSSRRGRLAIATVAGALALTGCVPMPWSQPTDVCGTLLPVASCSVAPVTDLVEVEYSQSQALPDFDSSTYTVTDDAELDRLEQLLVEHGVVSSTSVTGGCDGGRSTLLTWTSVTSTTATISVDTCTDDAFAADLDDLVSEWHEVGDVLAP